jgi:CheY-like chemotaxis protein
MVPRQHTEAARGQLLENSLSGMHYRAAIERKKLALPALGKREPESTEFPVSTEKRGTPYCSGLAVLGPPLQPFPKTPMRILIADDSEAVRRGVRALLESQDGWEICAEAENGKAAIEKAKELKPDIAILDIVMPVLSGFAAAKAIKEFSPDTAILVYSQHHSEGFLKEAARIGLDGYVSKSDSGQAILNAINAVKGRRSLASSA